MKVAQDWGAGKAPIVEVIVSTTFAGGTSATFQVTAVDSAGANPKVIAQSRAYPVAELVAPGAGTPSKGTVVHVRLDPQQLLPGATLTHLRLQTLSVGTTTAGAITAHLLPDAGTASPVKAHAAGY
jgi:hypothetical protein